MKILKIFGVVVGIHAFALILIFANPGCSSSTKPIPVPSDTATRADASPGFNVPNTGPRGSPSGTDNFGSSLAITFNPDAPAVAAGGAGGMRSQPTRPGAPFVGPMVLEPVADVMPATTYTVVSGDNLWNLAKKNHLAAAELAAVNNLKTTTVLHPGQKLIIPGRTASPSSSAAMANPAPAASRPAEASAPLAKANGNSMKHIVKSGETLGSIARQYGVKASDIAVANSISDPAKVRAGVELVIPGWQTPAGKSGKSAQKSGPESGKAQKSSPMPGSTVDREPTVTIEVPVIRVDDNPFTPAPAKP